MHGHHHTHVDDPGPLNVSPAIKYGLLGLGIVGLLIFFATAFAGSEQAKTSAWNGFTVSYLYFFFISMGAAVFIAIQYCVNAKWWIALKRIPEAMCSFHVYGGFLLPLIALAGLTYVYSWALPTRSYPYEGTVKGWWISSSVHLIKVPVLIAGLTIVTFFLLRASKRRSDTPSLRLGRTQAAIIFLIIFGFFFSLFAWDAVMSVSPKWFSTMWGVYCFAGGFQTALAIMMLASFWLYWRHSKYIEPKRHLYDVGTYVMGFSTFWMYIAFSQFMLIWYANIPDEIQWYLDRMEGPWLYFMIALPILKWVIPFFILMPSSLRANFTGQVIACSAIIIGHGIDMWWTIIPVQQTLSPVPTFVNIATFLGVFGLFGWAALHYLSSHSVLPVEDPDLLSSVNGEYLHA